MKILALLLLVPSLALSQSFYQCKDSEGKLAFQQIPCAGEGKEIVVKPLSNGNGGDASALIQYGQKLEAERLRAEQERAIAIKTRNERKAVEEAILEKGIVNGRSDIDRYCDRRDADTAYCNMFRTRK